MSDLTMDIIGSVIVIIIIVYGIFAIINGNLIVGWVWTICGTVILSIAVFDMWKRYKFKCISQTR